MQIHFYSLKKPINMILYLHFFGGMKGSIQQVLTIRGDEEDLRKIFYFSDFKV